MPLVDIHATPSRSTFRWFGLSAGAVLILIGFFLRHVFGGVPLAVLMIAGILLMVAYYLFPASQLPIIRSWQQLTYPFTWVIGHLFLLTIYFVILTPTALVARCFRYDPLTLRKSWRDASSSWHDRKTQSDPSNHFRQY